MFNRSIGEDLVFSKRKDCIRFISLIDFLRLNPAIRYSYISRLYPQNEQRYLAQLKSYNSPIISIIAYCLMPNHFHILIKQLSDNGLQSFMKSLQSSYAKYFNKKRKRKGPLFNPSFKAVQVKDDFQLIHVSRYIHLNPVSAGIIYKEDIDKYLWSSYICYLNCENNSFVSKSDILQFFPKNCDYIDFVLEHANYQRELQKIKNIILDL